MKFYFVPILALILIGLVACTRGPKNVVVRKVLIDFVNNVGASSGMPSREEIRTITLAALKSQPHMRFSEKDQNGMLMRVKLELVPGNEEGEPDRISVSVKMSRDTSKGPQQYFWGVLSDIDDEDMRVIIQTALLKSLKQVVAAFFVEGEATSSLLATLDRYAVRSSGDKERVALAIQVLGSRKESKAVKALSTILLRDHSPLDAAALGALTLIADPAGVDAVAKYAERKPAHIRRQAIIAMREMGGEKAAAWLFTMSTGYDDPQIRQAAEEALTAVEARMKKKNRVTK